MQYFWEERDGGKTSENGRKEEGRERAIEIEETEELVGGSRGKGNLGK